MLTRGVRRLDYSADYTFPTVQVFLLGDRVVGSEHLSNAGRHKTILLLKAKGIRLRHKQSFSLSGTSQRYAL